MKVTCVNFNYIIAGSLDVNYVVEFTEGPRLMCMMGPEKNHVKQNRTVWGLWEYTMQILDTYTGVKRGIFHQSRYWDWENHVNRGPGNRRPTSVPA